MNMLNVMILSRKGRIITIIVFLIYFIAAATIFMNAALKIQLSDLLSIIQILCVVIGGIIIPCIVGSKYQQLGLGCIVPTSAASFNTTLSVGTVGFFMLALQAVLIYAKGLIIMLTCFIRFIFTYIYKLIMLLMFKSYSKKNETDTAVNIAMKLYSYELLSDNALSKLTDRIKSDSLI